MFRCRILILMLICCVALREDFSFLVFGATHASSSSICDEFDPCPLPSDDPDDSDDVPFALECEFTQVNSHHTDYFIWEGDASIEFSLDEYCLCHDASILLYPSIDSFYTFKKLHI